MYAAHALTTPATATAMFSPERSRSCTHAVDTLQLVEPELQRRRGRRAQEQRDSTLPAAPQAHSGGDEQTHGERREPHHGQRHPRFRCSGAPDTMEARMNMFRKTSSRPARAPAAGETTTTTTAPGARGAGPPSRRP